MSLDVLTVGSTMRIPLLYREYSQWVERFMNYLEEQIDREAMINSIKNDKSMWSDQEKRVQKIDRLARSLLIQGLLNDIYSLIDSNKTAKDLWDAPSRHMLGSEYGEQDRKAAVLYEYETFKATEGELLLDTYIRYLQVINDLKKCGYSKDNFELNFKFLNNLQPEWKQYATMMRHNKNLMDINIDDLYNILKKNQGDVNDAMGSKKKTVVITSDPLALIAEKTNVSRSKEKIVVSSDSEGSEVDDFSELKNITALLAKAFNRRKFYSKPTNNNLRTSSSSQSANKKQEFVKTDNKREGHFAKDCKKVKVKDYEYYKTKMLLAKKDKDKQVLLAEDQAWMESSSDSDQDINANMVFMAQIEKVLSDSEASSSSADGKISEEHMAWQTDYCIMKEGMPILRGRKSILGMNSSEREMEKGYYFAFTLEKIESSHRNLLGVVLYIGQNGYPTLNVETAYLIARVDSSEDEPSLGENESKQGRKINDIDADEDITVVNDQDDAEMFNVNDLHGEDVNDAGEVNAASIATTDSAAATITINEVILAKALVELKASKSKAKGVVIQSQKNLSSQKKKDQIRLDEEAALKLQAELQDEFEEEQRLARERASL
nr:hypothetical protein [Tanacetum cinerariifolium]